MKRNVSGQKIGAQLVSATDGSAFTGSVTVYVTGDAGTQATGSVGSGACTHEGNGYHTYAPAQAETNYDLVAFTFTGTGAVPVTLQVFTTFPQTGDSFALIGSAGSGLTSLAPSATALSTAQWTNTRAGYLDNINNANLASVPAFPSNFASLAITAGGIVQADLQTIKTQAVTCSGGVTIPAATLASTTNITAGTITTATNVTTVNGLAAGVITASSIAADAITDAKVASDVTIASVTGAVGSVTGNVGGNVTGSVGSVVGAVGSVTGNVGGSVGSVTAAVTVTGDCATAGTRLLTAIELDGSVYRFTANALEQAPSGGGGASAADIADAVWDEALSGHLTAGSAGHRVGQLTFTVANQLDANMRSQAGATVYNYDFTLAAYSAGVITLPEFLADGTTEIADDDHYKNCIIAIVGGAGRGRFIRTTTPAAGDRTYNIETPGFTPDNTSQCIVVAFLDTLYRSDVINWKGSIAPAMTGDAFARLGAPAGASIAADIAAIGSGGGGDASWSEELPGDYTGNQAGNILWSLLTSGRIIISAPVIDRFGNFTVQRGGDYFAEDGQAPSYTMTSDLDLTDADVVMEIQTTGDPVNLECDVSGPAAPIKVISVDIASTDIASLPDRAHDYKIWATLDNDHRVPLGKGRILIEA